MLFIAIAAAFLIVFFAEKYLYTKHAFDNVEYKVEVSSNEIFEDEEIYIYEEITNNKWLPMPYIKADTQLPDGLTFHILEDDKKLKRFRETFPTVIHSVFVLRSHEQIRRRWRVRCNTRGTYTLGNATLVTDDILGSALHAKVYEAVPNGKNTVVVLPKAINLQKHFTSSKYTNGDFVVNNSLLSDPLLKAGVRDYVNGDPMNRINWKQTAVHNSLMVNVEEYTQRQQFNIVLNMQSRDIEPAIPGVPTSRPVVELAITVVATILDMVASDNIPVKLISNTTPLEKDLCAMISEDDEIGKRIFVSPVLKGTSNILDSLRMLAQLELYISTPLERMLDHITQNPYMYSSGGNIIFVSSYLSERMINFCYNLRKQGINMIFYITGSNNNAMIIPDDIEVHFRTYHND